MKRLILALALALACLRPAAADTFTQLLLGVDTTPTPSPVCIMSPTGICAAQLGTWNIGTSTWTPAGGGGGGGSLSFPQTVAGTTTSGGVPYFSSTTQLSSSGFLTANALMVGGGVGAPPSTVTTGAGIVTALGIAVNNASGFPLLNATLPTVGHCLQWGASGVTDAGGACTTGGGGGTVSSGNSGALTYYAATGTVVSGATTGTGVLTALGLATNALGGVLTTPSGACTSGQFLTFPTAGSVPTCATPAVSGLTVGTTTIASGTNGYIQYNNGGLLGEKATTGTGNVVLSASPTFSGTIGGTQVVPYSALVNVGANTVLGQVLAGTPTQLSVPSCSGTGQALNWTSGGGFGCAAISGSGGGLANVYDITNPTYGCVKSTSTSSADQGPCIQSAINAAYAAGGGVVWVPIGYWNLASQFVVKNNVTLQCAGNGRDSWTNNNIAYGTTQGSIFAVNWGSGSGSSNSPSSAAVKYQAASKVLNCGWWYPNQNAASASTPVEYGATLLAYDTTNGNLAQEIGRNECFNCYSFIDSRGSLTPGGGGGVDGANIHDNSGSPIFRCISFNQVGDWVTSRDNKFNSAGLNKSLGSTSGSLPAWSYNNGQCFYHGLGGWTNDVNNNAFGYYQCHYIDDSTAVTGFSAGGPITINGGGCDATYYTFFVTSGTLVSLQINGFYGTAYNFIGSTPGYMIVTASGATVYSLQVNNTYLFGPIQGALYGVGSTITSLLVGNTTIQSNTSVANAAWEVGSATNVSIMNSWTHGFSGGLEACAGTCTNTITTGSFNN